MNRSGAAALAIFLLMVFAVGLAGSVSTAGSVKTWYPSLIKPSWTPPSWVFGPVWTFLYITIALSGWLIWRERARRNITAPMTVFFLQLLLNGLWSYLFFGLRNPGLALVDITGLLLLTAAYAVLSWRVSRAASALFLPYICWVGFATALNYGIWTLN